MANISITLDQRSVKKDGTSPIKFSVYIPRDIRFYISSGVSVEDPCWNAEAHCIEGIPKIQAAQQGTQKPIDGFKQSDERSIGSRPFCRRPASEIKELLTVMVRLDQKNSVPEIYQSFEMAHFKPKTRQVYRMTINKLEACVGKDELERLEFEDITKMWLMGFHRWMSGTCNLNLSSLHLRNMRAVFNEAIENEITSAYPFRKFRIRIQPIWEMTLTVERLRELFSYDCVQF